MPKFKNYQEFTRSFPVALANGETLTVTYKPAKISTDRWDQYRNEANFQDADLLAALGTTWDWEDEKGAIIPVSREFLNAEVSIKDRAAIAEALFNDVFPTETSDSPGSSST